MRHWLFIAAVCGGLGVALGAFAAHGLEARLEARTLQVFETGARYQMYHALAMGLAAMAMRGGAATWAGRAAAAFLVGLVLFSGSLYGVALTGVRALGMITPLGGAAFLAGWVMLATAALRMDRSST